MFVNLVNGHSSQDPLVQKFKDRGLSILFIERYFLLGINSLGQG